MALETTKTTYLNGSSKDGNRVLANFSSSLSESGTMTINETISESTNLNTVEADFNEFRELAKNELKKLNTQDTEADVSSDKPVATPTSNNEAVKDDKLADTSTKVDDKPETGTPNEAKVSGVKDSEVKQPTSSEETNQPISGEEVKQPVVSEEIKQPTSNEEIKQPVSNEETKQPVVNEEAKVSDVKDSEEAKQPVASEVKQPVVNKETNQPVASEEPEQPAPSEEIKQPVSNEEVKQPVPSDETKVSDVKDGENVDESN